MADVSKLSSYAEKLPLEAKQRYLNKLQLIGGVDPLCISAKDYPESACLPPVEAGDLVSYLVLQTSYITAKQFKAHKSLEAYNQSTSGWVKDVHVWNIVDKYVVIGKVSSIFSLDVPQYEDTIHNNYDGGTVASRVGFSYRYDT